MEPRKVILPNNWRPRDYQMSAWRYLARGGKHCELVHHRRAGKDDLSLHWTAVSAFQKVGNYWHMLPKANQARKALWEAVNPHTGKRRIDEAFPKELRASVNDHEMMIRFINGSTWQVVGSDNFDSLVGSPPIGLVFSEWALCDPSSWAYLMPVVEENGGWVIFNTTPRGRNHAFRSVREAMKTEGHFGEILSAETTNVFSTEQLQKIKRNLEANYGPDYGASLYEQEYLCSFDAANMGAILGRWLVRAQSQGRISDGLFDPNGAPIEISSDIGFRDTAAWWFWQPRADGFALIDYDSDSGLEAKEWIKRLGDRCKANKWTLGRIWLPHDAKAKTFSASHSPMEQFIEAFGTDVVRVVPRSDKFDRINAARTVIEKCHFEKETTEDGRDALAAWAFVYDEERKEFSKEPDHNWACFTQDTEILTRYGTCRIMDLPENGEVLTPCGWKTYKGPRITRKNARLVEVAFADGHTVRCTPDHLFLTESGWKSAESLTPNTLIQSSLTQSRSISMAVSTGFIRLTGIFHAAAKSFIGMFGNQHSELSLQIATFTTRTRIQPITYSQIWNVYQPASIFQNLGVSDQRATTSTATQEKKPQSGTVRKKAVFGIADLRNGQKVGLSGSMKKSLASIAARLSQCLSGKVASPKNTALTLAEPLRIVSVRRLKERADTCCIHVADGEWFSLANGAVVHNSHGSDAFSYGCQVMQQREIKEEVKQEDRFMVKALPGGGFSLGVSLNELWEMRPKGFARV